MPTIDLKQQAEWREGLLDLRELSRDYYIVVVPDEKDPNRIGFTRGPDDKTIYFNPTLGPLPKDWIISMCQNKVTGRKEPRYKHLPTKNTYLKDPRLNPESLKETDKMVKQYHTTGKKALDKICQISGAVRKMQQADRMDQFHRPEIAQEDISNRYEYLQALDLGVTGGMNAGVFVVRLKGSSRLYVEKRFKIERTDDFRMAVQEIKLMHRVKHPALVQYMNGFITPTKCGVWMEYCDRGSLSDIIKEYEKKREQAEIRRVEKPHVPEKFIWHCFIGLVGALAYLRSGRDYVKDQITNPSEHAKGWLPILHRDIKPDNIFIKSRTTSGNRKYPYITLSDFGLACVDYRPGDERMDPYQKRAAIVGTPYWFAPELCYQPYGQTQESLSYHRERKPPTQRSDLWAVGAIIYNLAEGNRNAHIDQTYVNQVPQEHHINARCLQKEPKNVRGYYSPELRYSVLEATNPDVSERPAATQMVIKLMKACTRAFPKGSEPDCDEDKLPDWATTVHDCHNRPVRPASWFIKNKRKK